MSALLTSGAGPIGSRPEIELTDTGQNRNPVAQFLKNDRDHLRQGENNGNK